MKEYVWRPYQMPDNSTQYIRLPVCTCGKKARGPKGGVCGACGGGIEKEKEKGK